MSVNNLDGGAQGNANAQTPTTATPQNPLAGAPAGQPTNPKPEPAAPASAQQGNQGEGNKQGGLTVPKPMMSAAGGEAGGQQDGNAQDGEAYTLTFPEGSVVDPEAVATLNRIGKEFNVSGERAQELATAATEYGNRRVQAQMEHFQKGFDDFCRVHQEQTRAIYGEKTQDVLQESLRGLDAVLRTAPAVNGRQITSRDILNDPNVSAIANVPWFIHLCRTAGQYATEQPGVAGNWGAERVNDDFEW